MSRTAVTRMASEPTEVRLPHARVGDRVTSAIVVKGPWHGPGTGFGSSVLHCYAPRVVRPGWLRQVRPAVGGAGTVVLVGLSQDDKPLGPGAPSWPFPGFGTVHWDGRHAFISDGSSWMQIVPQIVPRFPGILAIWQGSVWARVGDVWAQVTRPGGSAPSLPGPLPPPPRPIPPSLPLPIPQQPVTDGGTF